LAAARDSDDVSDRQPVFLKDKGDSLYGKGNFRGALNAYSRALQIDPDHLPSLANRSACWLKLGDAEQCVDDCGAALAQVRPMLERLQSVDGATAEVQKMHAMYVRLLARKGAAYCQVTYHPQSRSQ
jgi:tetratricopeptide (TPR) repeat protein